MQTKRSYLVMVRPASFDDRYEVEVEASSQQEATSLAFKQTGYGVMSCRLKRETKKDKELDNTRIKTLNRLRKLKLKRAKFYHVFKKTPSPGNQKTYDNLKSNIRKVNKLIREMNW